MYVRSALRSTILTSGAMVGITTQLAIVRTE
jgi:hypothetical protein